MITTKGRYSIRILMDLLMNGKDGECVCMKDVARRQGLSLKYLERIMPSLRRAGLVVSTHGTGGGYRLARHAEDISLWDILSSAEGDLAPVACMQKDSPTCEESAQCRTLPVWQGYYELTRDYFSAISLADIADGKKNYTDRRHMTGKTE